LVSKLVASKEERFQELVSNAQACRLCPRMEGRRRVLSHLNGSLNPSVLFIAEAPGRLGGDRCGIPLSQDQTGRNFDGLLKEAGIDRSRVFITNAVLCNPRDARGNNAPPSRKEILNCSIFLKNLIDTLDPPIIVPLGAKALAALGIISRHEINLATDVARPKDWYGRKVIPLYHPGPRAMIHRPMFRQQEDYLKLARHLEEDVMYNYGAHF